MGMSETTLFPRYQLIRESQAFNRCLGKAPDHQDIALDIETTGLDPFIDRITLIIISVPGSPILCIDWESVGKSGKEYLADFIQRPHCTILFDAKVALKFLKRENISFPGTGSLFDLKLAQQLIASGRELEVSLSKLSRELLGIDVIEQVISDSGNDLVDPGFLETITRKREVFHPLKNVLSDTLTGLSLETVADIEFRCVPAVVEMELNGICLDTGKWSSLTKEVAESRISAASQLKEEIRRNLGTVNGVDIEAINLDSQPQMLTVLHKAGIPVRTTARWELLPLAVQFPLIEALINYRKHAKADQAFTGNLARFIHSVTGRIHPVYHQIGTTTGRLSCRNPNLQQIPRDPVFRRCFIPSDGKKFIVGDYSQIELRVLAEITGDIRMREAFQAGRDLHRLTASLILNKPERAVRARERQAAKAVNFGLIFAMGHRGLQEYAQNTFGISMTEAEARLFRQRFFEAYPGVRDWQERMRTEQPAESRTITGRRRVWDSPGRLTELCNAPIQGTAADIMKLALGKLVNRPSSQRLQPVGSIHDEIILEAEQARIEESVELLRETMRDAAESLLSSVPGKVDITVSDSWVTH